ncbi:MAG TPA: twin-arginine translocation signal domain-containing protein [Pyrinomonadaceae bacterium]|nr:twin-arginine translocation signal domain-containing protein [Pyrinomonadaceae bacterium]
MKITRRKFLGAASAAAAVLLPLKRDVHGQILAPGDALASLGWDSFLPFVNTEFVFNGPFGTGDVPMKLIEIKDSRPFDSPARKTGQENFVLKFAGPSAYELKSDTYVVEHFNLGRFNLFITEGAQKGKTQLYFAVINRVLS